MLKEIKYLFYVLLILLFLFFTVNFYFSDENKKRSYRSLIDINKKIDLYSKNLPILKNNTKDFIEYTNDSETQKKKKFYFWELIDK